MTRAGATAQLIARYVDALVTIGTECESFAYGSCRDEGSGRARGALFAAECWCASCVAADALGIDSARTRTPPKIGRSDGD